MAGLLDIAPSLATEKVSIAGTEIEVRGISNSHMAKLMRRFPDFGKLFAGASGVNLASLDEKTAAKAGIPYDREAALTAGLIIGEATPALIAAGVGHPDDKRYEEAADRLPTEDQKLVVEAILRLTNPQASRPLADAPDALQEASSGETVESTETPA